jgi:hypothetical protein
MKKIIYLLAGILLVFVTSCKQDCYDAAMKQSLSTAYCTMEYDPVCGCNGQTFGNSCEANREGFEVAYDGECH